MNTKILLSILAFMCISMISSAQENDVGEATQAIADFKEADPSMSKFFGSSVGYAVFPGIGKGGLGIGGAGGKGTVFRGGGAVGDCKMSQVTIGFQAGGQKYAEIIFFESSEAYERFVGNNFEFAAQVSAIAAKAGVSADAEYRDGMAVFTLGIGGLMYEASVGGQKFKTEMY